MYFDYEYVKPGQNVPGAFAHGQTLLELTLVLLHVLLGLLHQFHLPSHGPRLQANAAQHFFVQTDVLQYLLLRNTGLFDVDRRTIMKI